MARHAALFALVVALVVPTATQPSAATTVSRHDQLPLTRVIDVPLPGRPTRFDYQSIDPLTHTLYVAHLGDSTLDVVDLDTLRVRVTVPHLAHVHGLAVAPRVGRVYATATGTNELVTVDAATNKVIARTRTGRFPDGVAYDDRDGFVYVSDKDDGSLTVVDAASNKVVHTIKLGAESGNVVYDPDGAVVYAAVRAPDVLVAIDPATNRVARRIRLPGCDGAHGVYLDRTTRRAYIACERNGRLVVVDLRSNREIARATVGSGPDVLAFDSSLQRLYVASESGTVSVFDTSGRTPRKLGQAHFADGAHSVVVDQASHRVFFPLERVRGEPVLRVMAPTGA